MAIIPCPHLFAWEQVEASLDMDCLCMLLEASPDEALMQVYGGPTQGEA